MNYNLTIQGFYDIINSAPFPSAPWWQERQTAITNLHGGTFPFAKPFYVLVSAFKAYFDYWASSYTGSTYTRRPPIKFSSVGLIGEYRLFITTELNMINTTKTGADGNSILGRINQSAISDSYIDDFYGGECPYFDDYTSPTSGMQILWDGFRILKERESLLGTDDIWIPTITGREESTETFKMTVSAKMPLVKPLLTYI